MTAYRLSGTDLNSLTTSFQQFPEDYILITALTAYCTYILTFCRRKERGKGYLNREAWLSSESEAGKEQVVNAGLIASHLPAKPTRGSMQG